MNGAKLDVLMGMQALSYLQGVEPDTIKGDTITYERVNEPRGYEIDLNDKDNENNWRTGLIFSKKDKSLVSIGISEFVNMAYSDKGATAKTKKVFELLDQIANTAGTVDFNGLKFKVKEMIPVTNAAGDKLYPRRAYKAYNIAVEEAQQAAKDANETFSFDTWTPSAAIVLSCRGSEGLEDDARPRHTLVLKGI